MRNLLILSSALALLQVQCNKHPEKNKDAILTPGGDKIVLPPQGNDISRDPTNPDGGQIPGRNPELSVEESVARQKKNIALPILLSEGAAGITLKTPQSEVMNILANPEFISSEGFILYPEQIGIDWTPEQEDPTPAGIYIYEGYKGGLELPEPFGVFHMGDKHLDFLTKPADTLLSLGRVLSKSEGDCEILGTCYYFQSSKSQSHFFMFTDSTFSFDETGKLTQIVLGPNSDLPKRVKDPLLYGGTLAGLNLKSSRADVEAKLGKGNVQTDSPDFVDYDMGSITVAYEKDGSLSSIQVQSGYRGTFALADKVYALGDSFAEYSAENDDGKQMMIALDRILNKRDPKFDCSAGANPTCELTKQGTSYLIMKFAKNILYFSADPSRRFLAIELPKPEDLKITPPKPEAPKAEMPKTETPKS